MINFNSDDYELDLRGWGNEAPIFRDLIVKHQPGVIIEVGTWLGASAIQMATLCKEMGLSTAIYCVDTWLGALEMWTDPADEDRFLALRCHHGYPTIYWQFLANVIKTGHQDMIKPIPQTSLIASRLLNVMGIKADMIYIDASHDYDDVLADLRAYRKLLKPGGVIFGDDWGLWDDVVRAVNDYCVYDIGDLALTINERHWMLR